MALSDGLLGKDDRAVVVFSENGRDYRGRNPHRKTIARYHIDGGAICDDTKRRCDFACEIPATAPATTSLYLIELKGKDLIHACEQILDTMQHLATDLSGKTVHGRIVLSRVPAPDLRSTSYMRCDQALRKRGGTLKQQAKILEENL